MKLLKAGVTIRRILRWNLDDPRPSPILDSMRNDAIAKVKLIEKRKRKRQV